MKIWHNFRICFLLLLFLVPFHTGYTEEAFNDDDHTINDLYLMRNLARNDPVENILFAHVREGAYRCFKMDGSEESWKFVIYNVPLRTSIATYTLYKDAAKNLIDGLKYADSIAMHDQRYLYVVCKPLVIFSLRVAEPQKRMRFYRILSTETDEWKEYLPAFLTTAAASDGTLAFDWRLVYQVPFSIVPATSYIVVNEGHQQNNETLDSKRMSKQYLDVDYLPILLENWYKDHPQLTPHNWDEEYQRTLEKGEYLSTLDEINASIEEFMGQYEEETT